uniref:Uncharacterized protein n=1 Tax=Siphoviridae sp. ctOba29 TaxID=2825480 RepID=A0A8S5NX41_9CAUD|nr:MAG TPA: hypothetical protein [Siphoviridae sp. ctOba29]
MLLLTCLVKLQQIQYICEVALSLIWNHHIEEY